MTRYQYGDCPIITTPKIVRWIDSNMLCSCLLIAFTVIFDHVKPDSVSRKIHLDGFDYKADVQAILGSESKLKIKESNKASLIRKKRNTMSISSNM